MNKVKHKVTLSLLLLLLSVTPMTSLATEMPLDGEVHFLEGNELPEIIEPGGEQPIKPFPPAQPGTTGPLSIDFVSSFKFGTHEITTVDESYSAIAQEVIDQHGTHHFMNNFLQVTDQRGTGSGWDLTVCQEAPLSSEEEVDYPVLEGSFLKLTEPIIKAKASQKMTVTKKAPTSNKEVIITPKVETLVLTADQGAGLGTWSTQWGATLFKEQNGMDPKNKVSKTKSVQLIVPGKTPKSATHYQASLVWTIKSHIGAVE